MATRKNYNASSQDVQTPFVPTNGASFLPLARRHSEKPPRPLPEFRWLHISTLVVDMAYQHPLYPSAVRLLAKEFDPEWAGVISVNFRKDDPDVGRVFDGMTRLSLYRERATADPDYEWILAQIWYDMPLVKEARGYKAKAVNTKRQSNDMYKADCVAGVPDAVLLQKIMTKHGLQVQAYAEHKSRRSRSGEISCVASLRTLLLKRDPKGTILDETLQLIKETWPDDPPFTKLFLEAVFDLLMEQTFQLKWPIFVSKLQGYRVDQLRQEASQLRLATTPSPTMRKALKSKLIQLYNVGQAYARRLRDDVTDTKEEPTV